MLKLNLFKKGFVCEDRTLFALCTLQFQKKIKKKEKNQPKTCRFKKIFVPLHCN